MRHNGFKRLNPNWREKELRRFKVGDKVRLLSQNHRDELSQREVYPSFFHPGWRERVFTVIDVYNQRAGRLLIEDQGESQQYVSVNNVQLIKGE